jgi:hypothetical protein
VFYNQVKFRKAEQRLSPFIPVDSTDDEDSDEHSEDDEDAADAAEERITLNWKTEATIREDDSLESMISKANKHIEQARDMRSCLIGKAKVALDWYKSIEELPTIPKARWIDAVDCLVGNYCQNMGLPYLGEHQPGETYYFSPLTVNCFGIANVGLPKAHLTLFIYHEGEGKKGGNNVASLIYKYLDTNGLIN